jgi:acyl-CoA reductase-like NAD-dependent aldehyde dehydrogenase
MNDSPYGLTASVWTNAEKNEESKTAFLKMVDEIDAGTVFLNRCACKLPWHFIILTHTLGVTTSTLLSPGPVSRIVDEVSA